VYVEQILNISCPNLEPKGTVFHPVILEYREILHCSTKTVYNLITLFAPEEEMNVNEMLRKSPEIISRPDNFPK
jgi:hypothetical protein